MHSREAYGACECVCMHWCAQYSKQVDGRCFIQIENIQRNEERHTLMVSCGHNIEILHTLHSPRNSNCRLTDAVQTLCYNRK